MAIDRYTLFSGVEYPLIHYNGKGLSKNLDFYYEDGETAYEFDGLAEITLEIYDERQERRLFSFTSSNLLVTGNRVGISIPSSSIEFEYLGTYYYHLFWLASGGYEEVLIYGTFEVK